MYYALNFFFTEGHVDHHPDQRNGRRGHHVVAVVHVLEARVLHPDLDVRVPNPSLDRPSPSMPWISPKIKIGRGAARTSQTMVRGVIVIERGPRKRAVEARRNPVRRSGPATSQSLNNQMTKVDPHRRTTARRKRSRKARQSFRLQLTQFFQAFR